MKKMLVFNDDGWSSFMRYPAPATVEEISEHTVGLVAGTGVDIYQIGLITGNVAFYESKVLEKYGESLNNPYRMHIWRMMENIKYMSSIGTDFIEVIIEKCRKVGIEAHVSLRINDKHHSYIMDENNMDIPERFRGNKYIFPDLHSSWIKERPHLLLADGSLDFAYEEVVQLRLDTIEEILEKYDVDGIDLDFSRFPPFFKEEEKRQNTSVITDMVSKIKKMVDGKSLEKGKKIKLTARVEYDLEKNLSEGLDVEEWVKKGYLDMLYLGVTADCTPDAPAEPYINICRDTGCSVCPSIEGQFHWVGGLSRLGPVKTTSPEMIRAFASNSYEAGAAGIQFFNYCCADEPWSKEILDEVSYPERFKFKNKLYYFTMYPLGEFSLTDRWDSKLMLYHEDNEVYHNFIISDDLTEAEKMYRKPSCRMMMRIMGLNRKDDVSIILNNTALVPNEETENHWDWDSWSDILFFDFEGNVLKKGENILKIERKRNNEGYIGEIEVIEMELAINYLQSNTIGKIY